ncbi:cytochrome P450 [Kibdelosporangium phytohabitans]|uniref:Cytochrome n=1 Tax=Kibdelosporangium phytohabitans TaxID=860235 RepID=A0A0N9HW61_9PSEU|nr:cytochrome P450 [Kibdelosporangium phytohabitans]ALG09461.1 cytochrome [Kibdelosporangium phytohabitans]MBE1469249.1 cytochrome P450 [Kibdelosporangium phytohabitans]
MDTPQFPMSRAAGCPFDPPPELTAQAPVSRVRLWDGSTPWLVTGYADVRAVLADPRVSVDATQPGFPHTNAVSKARDTTMRTLMQMDPPDHTAQRRLLAAQFAIRKMAALRPRIQRIVDDLVDGLLAGPKPVDLVAAFALPVPSQVICELLGVPYADRAFFQEVARTLVMDEPDPGRAVAASAELNAYLEDLVVRKNADPGEDMLSTLAVEQSRTGAMTPHEIAVLGQLLLVAGHDTTTSMITLGTAALLAHPEQFRAVRDSDDPALVADAVDELLRYLSSTHTEARRVAREDLDIGGHVIRGGDGIVAVKSTANRDHTAFPEPDALDVRRSARHHVAFGHGRHVCVGAPLARLELQVVFSTLYRRLPGLALAVPFDELAFDENAIFYTVRELPVTW